MENFEHSPDDARVTLVAYAPKPSARVEVNMVFGVEGQSEAATFRTNVLQRTATKAVLLVIPLMVIWTG
jgi:hypothetical protein